jgi:alpha-methylacyl-CoA racemase
VCLERNPRLVYGRLTGWGQDGPYASRAGHDIDFLALAGALEPLGRAGEKPTPPINVLADFAGGGMLLAYGIACAVWERDRPGGAGRGQVVDAAMVDGSAMLLTPFYAGRASGGWGPRGTNFIDTGAPFYDTYETADGKYVAIGAIEPQFYQQLLDLCGIDDPEFKRQWEAPAWPELRAKLAQVFRSRSRAQWCELFEGSDACFAPVLSMTEAAGHPHNRARGTFVSDDGVVQPAPAPRFDRTPAALPPKAPRSGEHTRELLARAGLAAGEIDALIRDGVAHEALA